MGWQWDRSTRATCNTTPSLIMVLLFRLVWAWSKKKVNISSFLSEGRWLVPWLLSWLGVLNSFCYQGSRCARLHRYTSFSVIPSSTLFSSSLRAWCPRLWKLIARTLRVLELLSGSSHYPLSGNRISMHIVIWVPRGIWRSFRLGSQARTCS
jgi:hypothetical protein